MPETQKAFVENCSPDKKSYSSPKHCVPPTYPSRELVQQEQIYPSPADQLEEITLKEQRADITALPAPTAPPASIPTICTATHETILAVVSTTAKGQ